MVLTIVNSKIVAGIIYGNLK